MARLFVSDVHLDASAPQATAQFLAFLRERGRQRAGALHPRRPVRGVGRAMTTAIRRRQQVCRGLQALQRAGVPCFVHARQPRLPARRGLLRAQRLHPARPTRSWHSSTASAVLLTHGDALCTDDHSYQELRTMVRDPAWQRRFLALPRAQRELLADEARAGSKRHTARTVPGHHGRQRRSGRRGIPRRRRAPHDPRPHAPPGGARAGSRWGAGCSASCSAPGTSRAATCATRTVAYQLLDLPR